MITIVIDTREQRPWGFQPHLANTEVGTLKTGDYALKGDEGFAIERKSLDDFLGTIGTGWERFLRELGRMEGAGFRAKVIIVEGDFESVCFSESEGGQIISPDHHHPQITPQFVCKRIADLSMMGVSVLFAGNSAYAAALAYALLRSRYYEIINRKAIDKSRKSLVSAAAV